jgi:hypothetical protein
VPRIGITGHTNLSAATMSLVESGIRVALTPHSVDLTGVTCLAKGADQIFARVVLDLGGEIEVVLPAADYRARKVNADNATEFDNILARACAIHTMPFAHSDGRAYQAASEYLLSTVDRLLAVWDGKSAGGYGGTADVVAAARRLGKAVTVIWPDGAERDLGPRQDLP